MIIEIHDDCIDEILLYHKNMFKVILDKLHGPFDDWTPELMELNCFIKLLEHGEENIAMKILEKRNESSSQTKVKNI